MTFYKYTYTNFGETWLQISVLEIRMIKLYTYTLTSESLKSSFFRNTKSIDFASLPIVNFGEVNTHNWKLEWTFNTLTQTLYT